MTNNKKSTRYYSGRQEHKVAKALNGKLVANSGASDFVAGDVVTANWLIECKTCTSEKKSFTIKKDWLDKNKEEAFACRKEYNAVAFDFGGKDNYYIIDEQTFKLLVEMTKTD